MATSFKLLLAAAAGAALLGGCATGPYDYYDNGYGYDNRYGTPYNGYAYEPGYSGVYVAPPAAGLGIEYSDRERWHDRDHWRDRDWRWRDRDHDRDHDR